MSVGNSDIVLLLGVGWMSTLELRLGVQPETRHENAPTKYCKHELPSANIPHQPTNENADLSERENDQGLLRFDGHD